MIMARNNDNVQGVTFDRSTVRRNHQQSLNCSGPARLSPSGFFGDRDSN